MKFAEKLKLVIKQYPEIIDNKRKLKAFAYIHKCNPKSTSISKPLPSHLDPHPSRDIIWSVYLTDTKSNRTIEHITLKALSSYKLNKIPLPEKILTMAPN